MGKNYILIGNPVAGGGALRMILSAETMLRNRGYTIEVMLTSKRGDAESYARGAANRDDAIVIAAGGDGTYNEVANGLAHSQTPMAILPIGTTSVLAREYGIPLNVEKAIDIISKGRIETVNLGKITFEEGNEHQVESKIDRYFLLMAGVGIDAEAVYGVNEKLKKFSGRVAYVLSGLKALFNYKPKRLEFEAEFSAPSNIKNDRFRLHPDYVKTSGNKLATYGYVAVVSKAACYGGDFIITPDADMKKPYLYPLILHANGKKAFIRLLLHIIAGRSLDCPDISYFRTEEISIKGSSRLQIDGDYAGKTPARLAIAKDALRLVVP